MIRTLDNTPPIKAALRVKILVLALKMKSLERIKPKPPNLSNTPARIIEPITGASTWALGNHRWNPKQGSLTKNPKTRNREIPALLLKSERFQPKYNIIVNYLRGMMNTKLEALEI